MNNYDIKLLKEREDKYTILYGDIGLPEEFIVEAYNTLQKQKTIDYDAIMMNKCKEICDDIKETYPDMKFRIVKTGDEPYEDKNWFIYNNMSALNISEEEFIIDCGKIMYDLYLNKIFRISLVTNEYYYDEYSNGEGELYE